MMCIWCDLVCKITTTIRLICAFCTHLFSYAVNLIQSTRSILLFQFFSVLNAVPLFVARFTSAIVAVVFPRTAYTHTVPACIHTLTEANESGWELTLVSIKEIEEQNNCNQKYIRCSNKTSTDFMYVCGFAITFLRACVSQYKRL